MPSEIFRGSINTIQYQDCGRVCPIKNQSKHAQKWVSLLTYSKSFYRKKAYVPLLYRPMDFGADLDCYLDGILLDSKIGVG